MSVWNRDACFVRGFALPDRSRFRGRLLANGLDAVVFLNALAHNAALPLSLPRPDAITLTALKSRLDEIHAQTQTQDETLALNFFARVFNMSPEKKLAHAASAQARAVSTYGAMGDAVILGTSNFGLKLLQSGGEIPIRWSISAAGLVNLQHRGPLGMRESEALAVLNTVNGILDANVTLDMETLVRAWTEGNEAVHAIATTTAALRTEAVPATVPASVTNGAPPRA